MKLESIIVLATIFLLITALVYCDVVNHEKRIQELFQKVQQIDQRIAQLTQERWITVGRLRELQEQEKENGDDK